MAGNEWVIALGSLVVGIAGGFIGAYVGMKIGIARLEFRMDSVWNKVEKNAELLALHGDDLRTYDYELEDVMRKLDIPRKRRQNWRFES